MKKGKAILISLTCAFLCIIVGIYIGRNTANLVPMAFSNKSQTDTNKIDPENKGKVNINTATYTQLQLLPGIGEALAQNIIDYREEYGPFDTVDDLLNVKGIGMTRLYEIQDYIYISD